MRGENEIKSFIRRICLILAAVMLLSASALPVSAADMPFTDVPSGSWYAPYVQYVYDNGLMNGDSATSFKPNNLMTRAMLVTVLYRIAGSPAVSGGMPFADVWDGEWYSDPIRWGYENGVVNGTSATTFAPTRNVSRQDMVVIFYRYAQQAGYPAVTAADLSGYQDLGNVASYARDAMAWAVGAGIVNGDSPNTLNPLGSATRAECATIITRFRKGLEAAAAPEVPEETTPETDPPETVPETSPAETVPDAELTISEPDGNIFVGDTYQVKYTYTGTKSLTWTSGNTAVATIDSSGVVTAVSAGRAMIKVTDGTLTKRCTVTVKEKPATMTTNIDIAVADGPYNGVTRYVGDYVWIVALTEPYDANKDITITSSNPSVISVSSGGSAGLTGGVGMILNFNSAGSSTITLTSGDGAVSRSFTINVASGYSFGESGQLTPEQFTSYCTQVMCANGFTETDCGSWRQFTLSAEELTFARAVSIGQGTVHEWWPNGNRYCQFTYEGQDENGNYVFHECWG